MRKLALFSGGFALASALLCYGTVMWLYGSVALGVLALFSCFFLRGKRRVGVFCTALGLCAGLLYCQAYHAFVSGPMTVLAETQQPLILELCEYAAPTSTGGAKATVRVIEPQLRGKAVYYGDERLFSLAPGDRIRDTVKCKDAGFVRDEAVDTFTSHGVFLFLYSGEEPSFERAERSEIRYLPQQLAEKTKATIDGIFPARTAPFMRSLLMGDKSGLRAADSSALSEAGLFHITAVSGLHCGFLLLLVTWAFKAINRRKLAFFAIPILVFYALMTGASPSIVRACIMLSLFLIASLFYRESDGMTSLFFSLLLILLQNPYAFASVSLQLSYAAVAGLLFLTPRLGRVIKEVKCGEVLRFVLHSFSATFGALIFTVPLCAYYFGSVSLVAPLGNLLCLTVTSVVFGLGLAATLAALFVPVLGGFIAYAAHFAALYILGAAEMLTVIPYHALYFENPYLWPWLVFSYLLFAGCFAFKRGKYRYAASALCSVLALVCCITLHVRSFSENAANIVVTNVGQGQAIVLVSGGESALIDCGSSNYAAAAGNAAADILCNANCRGLDTVFLTHVDADHVNGLETLFARVDVGEVVLPLGTASDLRRTKIVKLARENGAEVRFLYDEKEEFSVGALRLCAYAFDGEAAYLARYRRFDFLATGDMERSAEKKLVKEYTLPHIEVLVAGHHGAKGSTQRELLDALQPQSGIVSVGSNSYGHPTDAALYRMTDRGMAVYRTDYQGNIYIRVN